MPLLPKRKTAKLQCKWFFSLEQIHLEQSMDVELICEWANLLHAKQSRANHHRKLDVGSSRKLEMKFKQIALLMIVTLDIYFMNKIFSWKFIYKCLNPFHASCSHIFKFFYISSYVYMKSLFMWVIFSGPYSNATPNACFRVSSESQKGVFLLVLSKKRRD